nr:chlorophyll a/b-binding protein [Prochlorococcus marinus]
MGNDWIYCNARGLYNQWANNSRDILMNNSYWKNAEITNGRLAMVGFIAALINYTLFGWIIPGFF